MDDEDENQCIRLVSFCKKHKQPSNERKMVDKWIGGKLHQCYDYIPPINPTGCARTGMPLVIHLFHIFIRLLLSLQGYYFILFSPR